MSEPKFVHLRVHTAYSLSEGAMQVPALIHKCHAQGIAAIAVTDTANMFGGKAFSKYASEEGVKPIMGCQFYLRNPDADDVLKSKGRVIEPDKIILLVMNDEGYHNIMKLMKIAYLDGPNLEKPQIRLQNLRELNAGLIALTGGVEGQIGRLLLENRKDEAEKTLVELKEIFPSRLYMEIMRIGLETEQRTEEDFINLAYKYDIPLVATNEAFFFDADMYEAHDALACIAAGEYVANDNRKKFSPNNRLRSEAEMIELFSDLPEAVESTVRIAERCNYLSKKVNPLLPIFECPDGKTQDEFITEEAYKGLDERMKAQVYFEGMTAEEKAEIDERYYARLEYELSVIKKMGFPGYFLIVSDFIRWSKGHGVPVGPGRGSGAGSIVAWSLKVTDLDPLKLDLLFERFLNPERINMPDFDVDFCQENDPQVNKLFDIAMKLEGLYRQSGVHAAGVVIGDRPLDQLVPLYKDPKSDMPVTQYDMKYVEETGLIKFDFLGLKTLTVIKRACDWVKKVHGVELDMDNINLDDRPTYELLQRGDTSAVFQFESPGMKDVHKQIKPDRFEDLIAIVSLYRPGPMDNIPSYIKRKHGEEDITYLHPQLEPILKETYGIMIYQEQVMNIARALGGYTMGGADKLRKVMGKKMRDEIPKQRKMFTEGAIKNGIEQATAEAIFDQMEKFASYGFNKSHAAAYSLISYQTAYLKAHYPVEFMCAVMSLDITNTEKLLLYKEECKKMGFEVLKPDINKSGADFAVEDGNIRYALGAIKGVGAANMQAIEDERRAHGPYKDLSDFIHRTDIKQINRRQMEQLAKAGAFDCLDKNRGKIFANIETIMQHIAAASELKTSSQASLFGTEELHTTVKLADKPDWPELEKLKLEAEAIGFYLSAPPLDSYARGMERLGVKTAVEVFHNIKVGDTIRAKLAGCVNSVQKRISKSGNKYAFVEFSDATSNFEGLLFSEGLARFENVLSSGLPVLVSMSIDKQEEDGRPRCMINNVDTLDKAIADVANGLEIELNDASALPGLKAILSKDRNGKNKIYIKPDNKDWDVRIELAGGFAFADQDFLSRIRSLPGVTTVKEI